MNADGRRATVFGATGRAGSVLVEELLTSGWRVRALVRSAARLLPRPGLEVVQGDARSPEQVREAIAGSSVVLCALGMTDITIPATDFSDSVKTIVQAMEQAGPLRLIAIASTAALDDPSGGYRAKGLPEELRYVAAEHLRNLGTLRASSLDWTLMCAATLRDDIAPGRSSYAYEDLPSDAGVTAYRDLAATMVELIDVADSFRKRVGIVSGT